MRQWPNDPTVAHLIFVDHLTVPTAEAVDDAIAHARGRGARAVRTSALLPRAADVMAAACFETIDELALLRLDLPHHGARDIARRTRRLHPWQHRDAARVDQDAFGPMWGNDAASLRDIQRATPIHRGRSIHVGRELAGFAISGAAGPNGYLQRLAVSTRHRRAGIARDLVTDALTWMTRGRLSAALVNTGVTNDAALALYDGLGFVRLDERLTIAELRLA